MVGYFEVEVDRAGLLDCLAGCGLGKGDLGHNCVFRIARHFLDGPFYGVGGLIIVYLLVALIFDNFAINVGYLFRHIELDVDEGCNNFFVVGGFELSKHSVTLTVSTNL